jgi:nicotinamidase-related amidase
MTNRLLRFSMLIAAMIVVLCTCMKAKKIVILIGILLLATVGNLVSQNPGKVKIKVDTVPTALLLIDIQEFYFPNGKVPLVNAEAASKQAAAVLGMFRSQNLPVIHIQHAGGSPIHSNVVPRDGEKVITKKDANGFDGTDLLEYLKFLKVKRLVICGMQTQMCVEATTRAAYDLGFKCIVVEDACATRNLVYNRRTVFANDVQACAYAIMNGYYARVMPVDGLE